jgi:hypothetical protein
MRPPLRLTGLLLLVAATSVEAARGAERCTSACRAQVDACRRAECAHVRGASERRACIDRCRQRFGCPTPIRTLAYVVTRCDVRDGVLVGSSQELRIQRGDCDPTTVLRFDNPERVSDFAGLCVLLGRTRLGVGSGLAGVFQRLGVTPDGSGVVFEVTNRFQLLSPRTPLTEEQEGFFHVRADGTGLRRLGPPSRDSTYRIGVVAGTPVVSFNSFLSFSPSGRLIGYTDRGTAPDGRESDQVFTLDVRTGRRTQVTRLPAVPRDTSDPTGREVSSVFFRDEHTIEFLTRVFDEVGEFTYRVRTNGTRLRRQPYLRTIPPGLPGRPASSRFGLTRSTGRVVTLQLLTRTPVNSDPTRSQLPVAEVFRIDGTRVLQLTRFDRVDTASIGSHGGVNTPAARGRRVLFAASADPLGENPFFNCQLFSVNGFGGALRQLTHFDEGVPSVSGCYFGAYAGCSFYSISQDPVTGSIVFYSNCDPLGTNPGNSAVFAMRPDGSALRQLTHTTGVRFASDTEVEVEIPGPIAYSVPVP